MIFLEPCIVAANQNLVKYAILENFANSLSHIFVLFQSLAEQSWDQKEKSLVKYVHLGMFYIFDDTNNFFTNPSPTNSTLCQIQKELLDWNSNWKVNC